MDENFTNINIMLSQLATKAITAASTGEWDHAIRYNSLLLEQQPLDIATLNRLGRAYSAVGNITSAQNAYRQVLSIEPDNPIAQKNLNKLTYLNESPNLTGSKQHQLNPALLIKKPGATKLVTLIHLGPCEVCASLNCGQTVELIIGKREINVTDAYNRHIGKLPDDLAYRMRQLINLGVTFKAIIKDAHPQKVNIIIQELTT